MFELTVLNRKFSISQGRRYFLKRAGWLYFLFHSFGSFLNAQPYRIAEVQYETDGPTSHKALEKDLQWDYQRTFQTQEDLEEYIYRQEQWLIGKQVFKEVTITTQEEAPEEGTTPLKVTVTIEEGWTFIGIPYYSYNQNFGNILGVSINYKNVKGTLTDTRLRVSYSPLISIISLQWANIKAGPYDLGVNFLQLWETLRTSDDFGNLDLQYSQVMTRLMVDLRIPLTRNRSFFYTPRPIIRGIYGYNFEINNTEFDNEYYSQQGLATGYNHTLEWDRVEWQGRLRKGQLLSVEHQIEYDWKAQKAVTWIEAEGILFFNFTFLGYNTRLSGFYYYNDFRKSAADRIRGILDYQMSGKRGFFWNNSLPIPIASFKIIGDVQLSPTFDMGFTLPEKGKLDPQNIQYSVGLSINGFPEVLPSLAYSIVWGINLMDRTQQELVFTSSLYY